MRAAFLLASLATLCACSTTRSSVVDASASRTLVRGYQTGIAEAGVCAARDAGEWRALWARHAATVVPRPDAPEVDFAHDMVVCVTLGTRPTFGYAVEIRRVFQLDDTHVGVEIAETQPAPDAILPQVVTQPYHMVVTPRLAGLPVIVDGAR